MKTTNELPNPADFMKLGEDAFNKNVHEKLRETLSPTEKQMWISGYLLALTQQNKKQTKNPIARVSATNIMKIKVSILNEFNTELSVYITDLDSYELSKKHNISIENSIDEMIYKIHFEQNFDKKNAEICNKSDSKKSETEIKIEEYCGCKSICNEYENKTCKGVEKRKTNKIMKQTAVEWLMEEMSKTYIFNQDDFDMFKQAKEMEKQQKGYSEEEMLELLHKFGFDYTYNYKGEKTIYEWIPEWFEEYKRLNN